MAVSEWYTAKEGRAEHLVYLNKKAKELEKLLTKEKTMIIRGAAGKKVPLGGRAKVNDIVYFVETGGNMLVTHRGIISKVVEAEKMSKEESIEFVKAYEKELNLSKEQYERWAGKKCLAVYEIDKLEAIEVFTYNRESNMDDWIITKNIEDIKL